MLCTSNKDTEKRQGKGNAEKNALLFPAKFSSRDCTCKPTTLLKSPTEKLSLHDECHHQLKLLFVTVTIGGHRSNNQKKLLLETKQCNKTVQIWHWLGAFIYRKRCGVSGCTRWPAELLWSWVLCRRLNALWCI